MRTNGDEPLTRAVETNRSYEVMEMHLFDENARLERALCGAETSTDYLRTVGGYLEDRLHGVWVGAICEACKARAMPLDVNLARDPEAGGVADEAQGYRELAETLARETGRNPPGG